MAKKLGDPGILERLVDGIVNENYIDDKWES
jgi:hypothetical protein